MLSKQEINFQRLLGRCEEMVSDKQDEDWRLESYIGTLDEELKSLKNIASPPSEKDYSAYTQRLEFVKGLLKAEQLPTPSEKVKAVEMLVPVTHGQQSTTLKEVHMTVKAKHQSQVRADLFETQGSNDKSSLRHRTGATSSSDIDVVLEHHQQIQQRLADEMVLLTRNLKENVTAAGDIVRKDTQRIQDSAQLADSNYGKLKVESGRLEGYNKTCNWSVWLLLVLIIATFLGMIIFMKVFKKKTN